MHCGKMSRKHHSINDKNEHLLQFVKLSRIKAALSTISFLKNTHSPNRCSIPIFYSFPSHNIPENASQFSSFTSHSTKFIPTPSKLKKIFYIVKNKTKFSSHFSMITRTSRDANNHPFPQIFSAYALPTTPRK